MRGLLALLLGLVVLVVPACSPTTVTDEPDAQTNPHEGGDEPEAIEAAVGDSITIRGTEAELKMEVTVLEVVDPAEGEEFFGPSEGNRLVGVKVRLRNVGTLTYDDAPSNGAVLIDTESQQYSASLAETTAGPDIGNPTIKPGDERVGFLTFELKQGLEIRTFQFTLDSGFGPQAGEWNLQQG